MGPRDEHGSTLSAQRAFVVHFGTRGRPGRRRFSGRVEHLSSGESMRFTSLKGLLAFFATALDVAAGAAPRAAMTVTGATYRGIDHDGTANRTSATSTLRGASGVLPRPDAAQPSGRRSPSTLHQHRKENRP